MDFTSDNAAGVAPEILAALARVNAGTERSYGDDAVTARLCQRFLSFSNAKSRSIRSSPARR